MKTFDSFVYGKLASPNGQIDFDSIEWTKHPAFEGVELKHIVTAQQTGGAYSYHLVKIAPDKKIGAHRHDTQLETHEVIEGSGLCNCDYGTIAYEQGVVSILLAGCTHEVLAGQSGLKLFAKFIPALC